MSGTDKLIKLFCFPHAGGTVFMFSKWKELINHKIEFIPIEYSGRSYRYKENLYSDFDSIIEDMYIQVIKNIGDSDFAIFGHSMGGLVAYEVSRVLKEKNNIEPKHIFISGRPAPNCDFHEKRLHKLPDEIFKREVLNNGGIPEILKERPNYLELYLRVLKNDFIALDTYKFIFSKKLNSQFTILNGKDDIIGSYVKGWENLTNSNCDFLYFKGGHFYIYDQYKMVIKVINEKLLEKYK